MKICIQSWVGILALVFATSVVAAEQTNEFHGYIRSNFQTGPGGKPGAEINKTGGFAPTGRLQEGQYFELTAKANLVESSYFQVTVARGGSTFHYTGTWPDDGFAIRDLYYQVNRLPDAPKFSLWFGSKMYRGGDIHLFDNWFLDNQNLLGGALAYHGNISAEFALGARKDSGYALSATGAAASSNGQRYLLIQKMGIPLSESKKLKTNFELHYLPSTVATGTSVVIPNQTGIMAGFELPMWNGANLYVNSGFGDVSGGITTMGSMVEDNLTYTSREGAMAAHAALGGVQEFGSAHLGVLYGAVLKYLKPKNVDAGTSFSLAVRPMYYLTDHIHLGVELDSVSYLKTMNSANDIGYIEVSPMFEYAMTKGIFGVPKFKVIASNAFYNKDVSFYGYPSKYAFNLVTGLELWF